MSDATKSKYQTTPWQPTVDTSNGDEKKAGEDYTDVYGGTPKYGTPTDDGAPQTPIGTIPTLTTAYTTAPDFVPTQGQSDGAPPSDKMGTKGAFKIDLGELKTSEQTFLTATTTALNAYEALKPTVTSAIDSPSIFGQNVGTVSSNSGYTWLSAGGWGTTTNMDPLDSEGVEFAATMGPELHNLMVGAAGVIELMGSFSAMLNNAGQMYTYTDSSAAFTDLP